MTERRYNDDEVRDILRSATDDAAVPVPAHAAAGLTLTDIQSIGSEVGLRPDAVARAAAALDARPPRPPRTSFGQPIEVGRMVPLERPLSDAEWEMVVTELRTTFGARGRVTTHGNLKEWSNGNLHACMEPTDTGYRIRLGTLKGDVATLNTMGIGVLGAGLITLISAAMSGEWQGAVVVPTMFSAAGGGLLFFNVQRVRQWARVRQRQMEQLAAWITARFGGAA